RARWLKEGDANTGYFHACINSRERSNAIVALHSGVGWIEKPLEVRTEVVRHFSKLFSEVEWERPRLDGIEFPQLSRNQNVSLVRSFLEEEVRCVVEEANGNKSPGPDSFNFVFIKSSWEIVGGDIMAFLKEFHENAKLPKALTSYFIALIPKVLSPHSLGEFRPISLLGSIYKVLSKVLTKRLSLVMDSLSKNTIRFYQG
ncbi:LINE-1 reverse transcriptase like, partial [Trifolium medium]|nr:LINE-1 reverse transcriptase like [Trifolium medium]